MRLSEKNNYELTKTDREMLFQLKEEYERQKRIGGNQLLKDHLERQIEAINNKNKSQKNNDEYLTTMLTLSDELDPANEVNEEEISYYNDSVDIYEQFGQVFLHEDNGSKEVEQQKAKLAARFFKHFEARNDHDKKMKRDKLKELVSDLYGNSITENIPLDDHDKGFIKTAYLLQYQHLETVELKLKMLGVVGRFEDASEEEIEVMYNMIAYRYLQIYQEYLKNISQEENNCLVILPFKNPEFQRYIKKFSTFFGQETMEGILKTTQEKIDQYGSFDSYPAFFGKAYLRAMAYLASYDKSEYAHYRQSLCPGKTEENELELITPLLREKMPVFMKYEEELKSPVSPTQKIVNLSENNKNKFKNIDRDFWDMMESAFGDKNK